MLAALIKGYRKGLIIALFSIIALVIGLAAALKLSVIIAEILGHHITIATKWLPFISFILVFILAVLLVNKAGKLIEKTVKMIMMGWINRLGGILLYMLLYTIIFSIFIFYAEKIHLFNTATQQASQTYPYLQPLGPKVIDSFGKIVPIFKNMFQELESFFGNVTEKISH
jgi:membrane protein required for colicin V production